MSNVVYIATSLDGYIAGVNGELDWLMGFPNPEKSDFGFGEFISGIDALIMGRSTFDMVASFGGEWPYPVPVFVLSSTLEAVPEHLQDKAEIVAGDLKTLVARLNGRGFNMLYIDGGKTVQSFMREELIDEMIISRIPVVLGDGIPLFGTLDRPQYFDVVQTETFGNGITKTWYKRNV